MAYDEIMQLRPEFKGQILSHQRRKQPPSTFCHISKLLTNGEQAEMALVGKAGVGNSEPWGKNHEVRQSDSQSSRRMWDGSISSIYDKNSWYNLCMVYKQMALIDELPKLADLWFRHNDSQYSLVLKRDGNSFECDFQKSNFSSWNPS
ncbi:hypothetical protein K474DRAFT_1675091 [Panus rudis PR-1116 ss-1]|nr:hypothetical protein K474DRAFT_1675091 [Panus rudis PR-1116 ss-1]